MGNIWTKKPTASCLLQWQPDVNDKSFRQGCGFVRADGCGDGGPDWLPQGNLQPSHMFFFKGENSHVVSSALSRILTVSMCTFG